MSATADKFIEWVDTLPSTWGAKRLGSLASVKARLGWKGLKAEEYVDAGYIFLSTPNLKGDEIDFENVNYITKARYDESPEIMLRVGDVLMVKDGATLGIVALVKNLPAPATLNGSTAVIRTTGECDSRFLCHWLRSKGVQQLIEKMKGGMGVPHLFQSDLRRFPVALPSLTEQRRIAGYLDEATGKVDRLVALRRRQMELLREQRAALIQQAVTRGLNPNAPLKDSGLTWLGQIPKHWEVKKLRHLVRVGNGSTPSRTNAEYWTNGKYPWLNSSVVNQDVVSEADQFVTELALSECHLPKVQPESLLVGLTGEGRTRGMCALLKFEATINQHLAYVTITKGILPRYLQLLFTGIYSVLRAIGDGEGSTKGALTCEDLKQLKIPLPSISEQQAILEHLHAQTTNVDKTIAAYSRQIELLTEYRAALIHECVTGQLAV